MDILFISINAVAPVLFMMIFGMLLKYKKVIGQEFLDNVTRLVFRFALPSLIFIKLSSVEKIESLSLEQIKLISLVVIGTIVLFFITKTIVFFYNKITKYNKTNHDGAMLQGSIRSNYMIVGYPILFSLFGDKIIVNYALIGAVVIPLYTLVSVVALTSSKGENLKAYLKDIIYNVFTNPLMIAVVLGFIFNFCEIKLPIYIKSTIEMIGSLATPLGLVAIGGFFRFDAIKNQISRLTLVTILKLLIYPVIASVVAYIIGLSIEDIVLIIILFGGPTAVGSFAMTYEMKGDVELAGGIIIITSILCSFTYIALLTICLYYLS